MKIYKLFSLCSAAIFAAVGLLFLFFADPILEFFNMLSGIFSLPEAPLGAVNFFLTLASAYMYMVTLLAVQMYRYPGQRIYPFILAHGKAASSLVSLYLFTVHEHYLIYIANFIVDGCIAIAVFMLMRSTGKATDSDAD